MTDESRQPPPADYAETLRRHFAELRVDGPKTPRYKMSARNKAKFERIRKLVGELRGGR